MPSEMFQAIEFNLRRHYWTRLIAREHRAAQPVLLSLVGPLERRYRPSDEMIATAAPATVKLDPPATAPWTHASRRAEAIRQCAQNAGRQLAHGHETDTENQSNGEGFN